MGTRTNILVKVDRQEQKLYRHWDGYLAETGADVATIAARVNAWAWSPRFSVKNVLNSFMAICDEATDFRAAHPKFELADELQGDIEHYYRLTVHDGKATVYYAARPNDFEPVNGGDVRWIAKGTEYTVYDFVDLVNADRQRINQWIGEKELDGTLPKGEYDRYEMIDVDAICKGYMQA